jgi:hypothetical protein
MLREAANLGVDMDVASTSSLVVAVVGVLGTLLSGILAHRSALRAKAIELEHARQVQQEERRAQERRELLEARRASYATFNQSLRQFHGALWRRHRELVDGEADAEARPRSPEVEEARRALMGVYAEVQMVASDEVMEIGGSLLRLLLKIRAHLEGPSREPLEEVGKQLSLASERLYEVRQTMRKDLGVTDRPVERPPDHDVLRT